MKLKDTKAQAQTSEDLIAKVEDPNHIVITPEISWLGSLVCGSHSVRSRKSCCYNSKLCWIHGARQQHLRLTPPRKIKITKGKKTTIKEKLFPGYMLVRMIVSDDAWLAVRTTQGVTGFVGTADQPTPLPENEVKAITAFGQQAAPKFQSAYTLGEAVRIVEGPFNDLLGTVSSIDEAKGKVVVLVSIFGRETPVELDFLQISKI